MSARPLLATAAAAEGIRYSFDTRDGGGLEIDEARLRAAAERARRASLADAVRVAPTLFPRLHRVLEEARLRVAPWLAVEAFVWSDPALQAWCISPPGEDHALLGITSGIVDLLEPEELAFVVGHEIGHALFGHVGHAVESQQPTDIPVLTLRALSRAAEISADRVGRLATPSFAGVTGAMLKVASGLGADHLRLDVGAFLEQLEDLRDHRGGALRTHPIFALRCRALLWFEQSDAFARLHDSHGRGHRSIGQVDERIEHELSASLGFAQAHANEEALRLAFLWSALCLFALDGRLEQSEQDLLRRFCGDEPASRVIAFLRDHGPGAIAEKLKQAIGRTAVLSNEDRDALLRDLEVLASSAGGSEERRVEFLTDVRNGLGLDRIVLVREVAPDL